MENRKHVKFIAPLIVWGIFLLPYTALAYGVETHAYLTLEVLDFYNKNYPNSKIPENLKPFLIDGSRREDDAPRWLNHFYDPVNDKGLSSIYGDGYRSKEWAEDGDKQNETRYKAYAFINSILTAWQEKQLGALTAESDFTWERAVEFYVKGDKEKAFYILGHVLHLLEDASVPDHTRNDPHPGTEWDKSPYENFAGSFSLDNLDKELKTRLTGKAPIVQDDVENYFNSMAKYSNNNFYSNNRIGISSGYELPVPGDESPAKIGSDYFAAKKDENGDRQLLFVYENFDGSMIAISRTQVSLQDNDGLVLNNYWSLLSTKAVQHGAGLIDLFFKEVAKAEKDGRYGREGEKGFFASTWDAMAGWWDGLFGDGSANSGAESGSLIDIIPLDGENQSDEENEEAAPPAEERPSEEKLGTAVSVTIAPKDQAGEVAGASAEQDGQFGEVAPPMEELLLVCAYNSGGTPTRAGLIINEVAWMGTANSSNDEWVELRNISGGTLDVSGWQLVDQADQIHATLKAGTKINAGQFLLLERTDDATIPNVAADYIYSGALSNSDEGLRLFNNKCELIDEALANPNWPAGDSSNKGTMERTSDLLWQTSGVAGGTPKAENTVINKNSSLESGTPPPPVPAPAPPPPTPPEPEPTPTPEPQPESEASEIYANVNHIVISEIQAGTADASGYEFIELYNPTETAIDLTGWELRKKTSSGAESNLVDNGAFSGAISPKSFFLIASPSYNGSQEPDLRYSAQSAGIAYSNNSVLIYNGDHATAQVADEVAYVEIAAGKSLERKTYRDGSCVSPQNENEFVGNGCDTDSASDFESRETPNPQNTLSLPEPREAPVAVNDLEINFNTSSLALIFDWQASSSANNLTYEVKEYNSPGVSIYTGTSTTFEKRLYEVGRDYRFGIMAIDKDGFTGEEVFKEISVPGILPGIYFYQAPTSSIFGGVPIIGLQYDSYPFLPDFASYDSGGNWKILVFYKNREAPMDEFLNAERPADENLDDALMVEWESCAGSLSYQPSLLLPDSESQCGIWGGFMNGAMRFSRYLANNFNRLFLKASGDFSADDYLTIAYYGFYRTYPQGTRVEDGANDNFKLLAVDKIKYYFGSVRPVQAASELEGELSVQYLKNDGHIVVSWNSASDADTPQSSIEYEINFSESDDLQDGDWQNVGAATSTTREVFPGDSFIIGVRAKDDFGNYSNVLTNVWFYPETEFFIEQLNNESLSASWGEINVNCGACGNDIDSASLQSIYGEEEFDFNKVTLDIRRNSGEDQATFRLALYGDSGSNAPDFSNKIAEAQSDNGSFAFAEPVLIEAGKTYWLVLDVRYADARWYYRNSFQNAIGVESSYEGGASGMGASSDCSGSYCPSLRIPHPGAGSDWYMRIGLE